MRGYPTAVRAIHQYGHPERREGSRCYNVSLTNRAPIQKSLTVKKTVDATATFLVKRALNAGHAEKTAALSCVAFGWHTVSPYHAPTPPRHIPRLCAGTDCVGTRPADTATKTGKRKRRVAAGAARIRPGFLCLEYRIFPAAASILRWKKKLCERPRPRTALTIALSIAC